MVLMRWRSRRLPKALELNCDGRLPNGISIGAATYPGWIVSAIIRVALLIRMDP